MPDHNWFQPGEFNFDCEECGRTFKSSHAMKRWDDAIVCDTGSCFEMRHPQDFVRAIKDDMSVPWARPDIHVSSVSALAGNISAAAVAFTVTTGTGGRFPAVPTGTLMIEISSAANPQNVEKVKVATHVVGTDSFTSVTRAQLGTRALAFVIGDMVTYIGAGP